MWNQAAVGGCEGPAKHFGYSTLKSMQVKLIKGFATGHDVYVILLTDYGKSWSNACLPLVLDTQLTIITLHYHRGNPLDRNY